MLFLLARFFEHLVDPYPVVGPVQPPAQFLAFLWRCADGLRVPVAHGHLLTADIAAAEPSLFGLMASLVDWFAAGKAEQLRR